MGWSGRCQLRQPCVWPEARRMQIVHPRQLSNNESSRGKSAAVQATFVHERQRAHGYLTYTARHWTPIRAFKLQLTSGANAESFVQLSVTRRLAFKRTQVKPMLYKSPASTLPLRRLRLVPLQFGHNLGLRHAGYLEGNLAYGDFSSVMGSQRAWKGYNAAHRDQVE
eukprot:208276-Pleurochrysis_carterae.AAC.9